MNFKKIMVGIATGSLAVSTMVAPVFADDYADGTAHIYVADGSWASFDCTEETALITGDGQYTVSITATETQASLCEFCALLVQNGESAIGGSYIITIDSITVNGVEQTLQGSSYTCSSDGKGVETRVNIYNAYNNPSAVNEMNDDLGYVEERAVEASDYTACLLDSSFLTDFDSMSVTFTVSNYPTPGDTVPVAYLASIVAVAGVALVASKKVRA